MKTFDQVMTEFKALTHIMKQACWQYATATLVDAGFNEVGSSDVNHQIVKLYNEHGSFQDMMIQYTEYLFG